MEIQELTEISEKIYSNLQELVPKDIKTIEEILLKENIEYGKIRTFDLEDSQIIILLILKQNCLILIKHLLENGIEIPIRLLELSVNLLDLKSKILQSADTKKTDLHAQIEKERVIEAILNLIIDIIYISKYTGQNLKDFLKSKRIPDSISVNLVIAVDFELELESFELAVLNKKLIGPVLLSLIKSYKNSLRKCAKNKIISEIKPYIFDKDKNLIYEIFYLINTEKHKDLLIKVKPEKTDEYFGFVSSLIVDKDSAELAYSKLEFYFEEFENALKLLLNYSKLEDRRIHPKDEKTIISLLECINKLVKYKSLNFYKYVTLFQNILKIKICREIKGLIYEILCKYISEKDVYIEKVVECRDEIENEIQSKSFFLLPRVIRFLNAYKTRETKEIELLKIGASIGSPYISSHDKSFGPCNGQDILNSEPSNLSGSEKSDFRNLGFKSEDPNTIIECLDAFMDPELIKLNSSHIRAAMLKDSRVIEKIIQFQIENKIAIEDITLVNIILCFASPHFFEYVRLFKDFTFYLNGDFLERLSDNLYEGIKWINDMYCRELGIFILRNCSYFNDIIRRSPRYQNQIISVYEKIFDENLGDAEFGIFIDDNTENDTSLLLYDTQEFLTEEFFRIFAKQLLYLNFYTDGAKEKNVLDKPYSSQNYEIYVKAKIVCGLDISRDLEYLKSNLILTDDILGYLKIVGLYEPKDNAILTSNILLNFGIKDSAYVLKNFESSSDFERFILFFNIGEMNKELESLIKNHILNNMKTNNDVYFKMCILQLFKCKDLDHIIKILERSYDDKETLFKLCLQNIINGGKYFSKSLFDYSEANLKSKALFLIYYLNIWDKEYILEIIEKMDSEISDEMRYLVEDIKCFK